MEKKIKKFLKEYKRVILLGLILAGITAIGLYISIPSDYNPSQFIKSSEVSSADIVINALNGQGSVFCTIESTNTSGEVYVRDGKIRLIESGGEYGNVIFDGKVAYIWNTGEKEGMLIDIEKNPLAKTFINESQIRQQIEAASPTCIEREVDVDAFNLPLDVVFSETDLNMQNILNGGR